MDFGKAYLAFPTVTVTLRQKTAEGTYTDFGVNNVVRHTGISIRRGIRYRETTVKGGAFLDARRYGWHFFRGPLDAAFGGLTPKLGDIVIDPVLGSFVVEFVDAMNHLQRLRVLGRAIDA